MWHQSELRPPGKSSLMDILAQRKKVGQLSGQLLLNGRPAAPGAVVRCAAYVPQVRRAHCH